MYYQNKTDITTALWCNDSTRDSSPLSYGLSPYKATNFKFNIMELNNKIADVIIKEITQLIENVENENQKNDQWFLKFLDDLNSLSVKY